MDISYEDFAKLDIRIGTIVEVEVVPDADKLLRLVVDTGEAEKRQIVSGIRTFFEDVSVLEGMQCAFVVNLAPRVIRGFESQGMILGVGDAETFTLLSPQKSVPPGTTVR